MTTTQFLDFIAASDGTREQAFELRGVLAPTAAELVGRVEHLRLSTEWVGHAEVAAVTR